VQANDIRLDALLDDLPANHPLAAAVRITLEEITPDYTPSFTLQLDSNIPISAGMGSGAAVTVAIVRALSAFLGGPLPNERISALAYEVEKLHHGTPSGIDNTVVTYQKPVFFQRNEALQTLSIAQPTFWVIADTGEKTPTKETVADVRAGFNSHPEGYQAIFDTIGAVAQRARQALSTGDLEQLGELMNENQRYLEQLQVSGPALEALIAAARSAGAVGAKLSGGGRGGNMIALVPPEKTQQVSAALQAAGAVRVITTVLRESTQ
jgi:mevalonate kinase